MARVRKCNHAAGPDERIDREPVDGVRAVDEVDRRIDVRAGVIAKRDQRDVRVSAHGDPAQRMNLGPGSPGQVTMSGRRTSDTSWIFIDGSPPPA